MCVSTYWDSSLCVWTRLKTPRIKSTSSSVPVSSACSSTHPRHRDTATGDKVYESFTRREEKGNRGKSPTVVVKHTLEGPEQEKAKLAHGSHEGRSIKVVALKTRRRRRRLARGCSERRSRPPPAAGEAGFSFGLGFGG